MEESKVPILECVGICKSFGKNNVLKGIDLTIFPGDVLSIIGGNGAGKSTLMKIIMGIYSCDKGDLKVGNLTLKKINPALAISNGIYLVPQEPMLFSNMTIEENVLLGLAGSEGENKKKLSELVESLGWNLELSRKAATLSIAEQQLVEIIKGLIRDSKILILDEPTSSLTFNEIQSLFQIVEELKLKGVGIIYITHRLNEVFEISNRVAIMRDGKVTLEGDVSEFDTNDLINALLPNSQPIEKKDDGYLKKIDCREKESILTIDKLTGHGFSEISLQVKAGEILGLAGVVGAGRTELAETIFGRDEVKSGKVFVAGTDITKMKTKSVIKSGLNYVPEDRFKHGIFKISSIGMNISASSLESMGKIKISSAYENGLYKEYQNSFSIKATDIHQEIGNLSGGNQQKVVIAKTLASIPKVIILDEPTRGIDAGAREDVYKIIFRLREQGVSILLISSDMEEIVKLSDRALTMYRGKINGEFIGENITPDNLMSASFGIIQEGNPYENISKIS